MKIPLPSLVIILLFPIVLYFGMYYQMNQLMPEYSDSWLHAYFLLICLSLILSVGYSANCYFSNILNQTHTMEGARWRFGKFPIFIVSIIFAVATAILINTITLSCFKVNLFSMPTSNVGVCINIKSLLFTLIPIGYLRQFFHHLWIGLGVSAGIFCIYAWLIYVLATLPIVYRLSKKFQTQ